MVREGVGTAVTRLLFFLQPCKELLGVFPGLAFNEEVPCARRPGPLCNRNSQACGPGFQDTFPGFC